MWEVHGGATMGNGTLKFCWYTCGISHWLGIELSLFNPWHCSTLWGSGTTHTPCPLGMFKVHPITGLCHKRYFSSLWSFTKLFLWQYPVTLAVQELKFLNMWWSNLDRVTFPGANVFIFFLILSTVLIHTHYSYKVTLQGEEPHWMHWKLLWMVFGRPSVR